MRRHISLRLLQLARQPGRKVGFIGGVNFADANSLSALSELYAAESCSSNVYITGHICRFRWRLGG